MIETRKNEIRFKTSDPEKMLGKYTVERVMKHWNENVVDSDTGKTMVIERSQILFDRGIYISNDVLSEIRFFLDDGSITEIEVSNQKRMCVECENTSMYPFRAVVAIDGRKHSFLLYATGIKNAMDILNDYVELNYFGRYIIVELKQLDYCVILVDKLKSIRKRNIELDVAYLNDEISIEQYLDSKIEENDDDMDDSDDDPLKLKFYQIGAKIISRIEDEEDEEYNQTFIVQTFSAVRANLIIEKYLRDRQEERYQKSLDNPDNEFVKRHIMSFIEESKIINVGGFIPKQFSEAYYED
ncbi:MAG: RNA polymerase subunit sigma [Clostridia bacterium]|nr:RNA polymerase subunit sigma [Clostridia bacterium]